MVMTGSSNLHSIDNHEIKVNMKWNVALDHRLPHVKKGQIWHIFLVTSVDWFVISFDIYEDFGARSRYHRQRWIIASYSFLWTAITYPCLRYLLRAPKSSYVLIQIKFQQKLSVVSSSVVPWAIPEIDHPPLFFAAICWRWSQVISQCFPWTDSTANCRLLIFHWFLSTSISSWDIMVKDGLLCVDSYFFGIQCIVAVLLFLYPQTKELLHFWKKIFFIFHWLLWPTVSKNRVNIG